MLPKKRVSTHPGEILREEFLRPLGITQNALAATLGVTFVVISELVNGRRAVSPRMAAMLGKALGTSAEFWAGLQADYDLTKFLHSDAAAEVKKIKPLVA